MQGSNNNNNNTLSLFDNEEFNLMKPLAISQSLASDGQHYRAIESATVSTANTHSISDPFCPSNSNTGGLFDYAKPVQCNNSSQTMQMQSRSLSTIETAHFDIALAPMSGPPSKASKHNPQQPITTMTTTTTTTTTTIIAPPSLICRPHSAPLCADQFVNHLNSCVASFSSAKQCLDHVLSSLNRTYSDDIDFHIDYTAKQLNGMVFISDNNVEFTLFVWPEGVSSVRVEFRRIDGHALAAAQLWSHIKDDVLLDANNESINNFEENEQQTNVDTKANGFACLSMDMNFDFEMDDDDEDFSNMNQWNASQLDQLVHALQDNDEFVLADLQELLASLRKHGDLCDRVMSDASLMMQLVDASLMNADVCVSRCVLPILYELATHQCNVLNNLVSTQSLPLYTNLSVLLGNNKRRFIRRWSIRVLSKLCDTNCAWTMDSGSKQRMIDNVKRCASKYDNDVDLHLYTQPFRSAIEQIRAKVMQQ